MVFKGLYKYLFLKKSADLLKSMRFDFFVILQCYHMFVTSPFLFRVSNL